MSPRTAGQTLLTGGVFALGLLLGMSACGGGGVDVQDTQPMQAVHPTGVPPAGSFPVMLTPPDNPLTPAKADLGRHLFYEQRLSGNGTQSCASCHHQDKAFTDGLVVSIGSTGEVHPRNAQPLANVGYSTTLTWANPSLLTLEKQMEVPLFGESPVEMGVHDGNKTQVLARIAQDVLYQNKFKEAFPESSMPITWGNVIKAIASFQRTLISSNSKFDQAQRGELRLTDSEMRGESLFFGEKAECFHCHGSFNFNDQVKFLGSGQEASFHNTGLFNIGGTGAFPEPNRGVFELTGQTSDMGKFRAQSLRNIALTAPYMHDGSVATLEEVLDFYAAGGRNITSGPHAGDGRLSPFKSSLTVGIALTSQEKADLIAFLKTLTDETFVNNPEFANPFKAAPSQP